MPTHKNMFGELISVQMHAAHVFTPGRIQETTLGVVYFLSSLRAQTAKTLICRKSGFSPIPERVPKSAENHTFCAFFAHFLRKKCGFPHFLALFLESAETPLVLQIHVFVVWALRLDRKHTTPGAFFKCIGFV